ncbi:UDP binding domain-containing protein [Sphingobacterium sp. IITKGP-BTPF85]|uniref:UDP binding domain-containing protein n=1 Tax=Sphingobacterium sp. IITKGP-BTPF85 TaxID=1338009 RepID=UPI0004224A55|nr:UDP binding domain-containing protein [Sphingobacterium sp. IITKGP-BTPF85]KKX51727.1 hypothetical protein L950_0203730 [Sphingobacterium sp. IITKGP-BTPF85]
MIKKDINVSTANTLILGVTFKENCPDVRNTKVVDVYSELIEYGVKVDIYDPWANYEEVKHEYAVDILSDLDENIKYDAVILAVSHNEFLTMDLSSLRKEKSVLFDIKACLDRSQVDGRL